MKLAYVSHNYTLQRIQSAQTVPERKLFALNYFLYEAPIVNEEMKEALQRIDELEKRILELEDNNGKHCD